MAVGGYRRPSFVSMPSLKRVVVTDHIVEPLDVERSVLENVASVEALDLRSASGLEGRTEDADGLMVYHYVRLGREIIDRLDACRVIVRPGVGSTISTSSPRESETFPCATCLTMEPRRWRIPPLEWPSPWRGESIISIPV